MVSLMSNIDYIVVGLGNPGKEYEKTRHNIGFMTLDFISQKSGINFDSQKFKSLMGMGKLEGKKIILLKPQTYMNLSGQSVIPIMSFYKVPPERVIIIFDDISLCCGKIRIRKKGSHGGHNGVRNIIEMSGCDKFPRIKIGVGNKPNEHWNLADWVLSKFSSEEMAKLSESFEQTYEALKFILSEKTEEAMNKFN
mgnify:CR=1 FL=1